MTKSYLTNLRLFQTPNDEVRAVLFLLVLGLLRKQRKQKLQQTRSLVVCLRHHLQSEMNIY